MTTTIRNHAKRRGRRARPKYPVLNGVGDTVLVERPECGLNIEHPIFAKLERRPQRVLKECFVYGRTAAVKPSRSKYEPHYGHKQHLAGNPFYTK